MWSSEESSIGPKGDGQLRVAISGKSGCGNSTVTKLVARKLGIRMINYTFRTLAEEQGVSFAQMRRMAEEDPRWDRMVDRRQWEMALEGSCVLGSRLAVWVLREEADLKVFLDASEEERARRIQKREGGTFEEKLKETITRDKNDHERYLKIYGIDNNDYGFCDLIVDTERHAPEEIAELIAGTARSLRPHDSSRS
ncbi:MAG: (d)CMP kinase [Alkalispirochaetaceae bacterium]